MVKDDNGDTNIGNETFSVVGTTYFYIDKENKIITPKFEKIWIDNEFGEKELCEKVSSYMKSYMNDKYAGIGTRLHQIRIERMLINQLGNICIVADGNSFPFHYNLGFRLGFQSNYIDQKYLIPVLKELCNYNKKSQQYNLRFVSIELKNRKRVIDINNSIEKCLCDYYKNGGTPLENFKPNMFLTQNSFEERGNLILTQPILLNMETENTHD